mmetsp:Transcript_11830/g.27421  ORF Transcript_11830/g.27421 Transcript_11830/m.27421 type:complete len:379 (-) Transcript_11830:332-1468(-)|eukprot:CAMPEP_0119470714 /NCGR_PEP_ID=MMETSP1344-20130328/3488_1 /TAXON_ID=236787 /ORGANISM="Florenciella parvula, Strain CCMP2471" /LENGTH=378 /DNA_ID=CAMNT_0007503419 /DNA_START=75 /DNA_END=1211 /DNA_ORIENTATION=+
MAEARPMVTVFGEDGASASEAPLPAVFSAPIRPDLVRFVHTNMAKNNRQPYAVSHAAGHQTSAQSWGTGRAVSRIPRVQGGGTQRSGQAAFGNMCRGGRMFAPTRVWRKWNRKINLNQRRYAVASALAASAVPPLVMARGHKIDEVPEMPLVVGGGFEAVTKTSKVVEILGALGCDADVTKCKESKKLRAGKGKMRNRRYTMRRGPLIVHDSEEGVKFAARNLPGVDLVQVERLNLLQLAPGGHMGRFCIWTEAAFAKLDSVFGNGTTAADLKKGYVLPKSQMTNADLARIINSDEVQSTVNPAKEGKMVKKVKKNPLKNIEEMEKLNPYVRIMRQVEQKQQEDRKAARAKTQAAKRAAADTARAFIAKAEVEGELMW